MIERCKETTSKVMQYMRKIRLIHRYRRHVAEFLANSELTKTKYIKAVTFY